MKLKTATAVIALVAGLFATRAFSQHEEHHQDQAAQPADKTGAARMGGMMSGNMMSQMMMGQSETSKIADQLARSFAAIEIEKDPATLKTKLAEHGALIKELQTKVQAQSHMMDMMQHMMGMGTETKK